MRNHPCPAIYMLAVLAVGAVQVAAQGVPQAADPFRQVQPGALKASLEAGEEVRAPATEADEDIGEQVILAPSGRYQPLTFIGITGLYWTDNAALTEDFREDDNYWYTQLALTYLPQLAPNIFAEFTVRQQFYVYDKLDALNFNSLDAGGGLVYVSRALGNTSFLARYNYERLTDGTNHDEFFTQHQLEVGFFKPFVISYRHEAYLSYLSEFSLDGNPDFARYNDHSLTAGYRFLPIDPLRLSVYYRAAYRDYDWRDQGDFNQIVGAVVSYDFNDHVSLSASASWTHNDSDQEFFDYEATDIGARVLLSFSF